MSYKISLEGFERTYDEIESLYREHYQTMIDRMAECGVEISPYNPRKDAYFKAGRNGSLLTFILRYEGDAVGYCNIYLTHDMHNFDMIATEDAIYVTPEHRKGSGRLLCLEVHEELKRRKVKRLAVTTSTDLRVSKWLERLGYKHTAHHMTKTF